MIRITLFEFQVVYKRLDPLFQDISGWFIQIYDIYGVDPFAPFDTSIHLTPFNTSNL
jgi:hypothetical protein